MDDLNITNITNITSQSDNADKADNPQEKEGLEFFAFQQTANILQIACLSSAIDLAVLDELAEILRIADLDHSIQVLSICWGDIFLKNINDPNPEILENSEPLFNLEELTPEYFQLDLSNNLTDLKNLENLQNLENEKNEKNQHPSNPSTEAAKNMATHFDWAPHFLIELNDYDRYHIQKHQFYHKYLQNIESFSKIIVMQIDAHLNNIATELALLGDFIIASERSQFTWSNNQRIQIPFFKGRLAKLNQAQAIEFAILGKKIHAFEALHLALIDQVEDAENLNQAASNILQQLAKQSPELLDFYKNFNINKNRTDVFFQKLFNEGKYESLK